MIMKRSSKGLVLETLNYKDWKLVVLVVEDFGECCWVLAFAVLNGWLHMISSCVCLHQVFNSLPCQVWPHHVTLKWEKDHKKESLWRRKTTRECERKDARGRPWERERERQWESRSSMIHEEQDRGRARERKGGSKRTEEIGSEWEGNATLITILISSFIQLLDENIFYPIMNKIHVYKAFHKRNFCE
jgi:hypothetical protein